VVTQSGARVVQVPMKEMAKSIRQSIAWLHHRAGIRTDREASCR
jgi:hypothetical protein